jgi:protein-tyrosine kinase
MSEFFKALEQAERDRVLAEQARTSTVTPAEDRATEPPRTDAPAALPAAEAPAPMTVRPRIPAPESWPEPGPSREWPEPGPSGEVRPSEDEARDGIDAHMVSLVTPTAFEAEQYRTLRHMIEELRQSAQVSVIACTSPAGGDGKTTTAINLAGALGQSRDAKVLLIDADLRRPTVARELTLDPAAGSGLVGAILNRELSLAEAVCQSPFNVTVLPAGRTMANPFELLKSPRLAELIQEARRDYDYVILDTPPLLSVPDCRAIAPYVDGFLFIVAAHRTPRKLVEEGLNVIEPAKILGLVFNRDDRLLGGYYGYGSTSNGHDRQGLRARARGFLPRRRRGR